ncbi:KH domain-containing protein [Candidatus Saccharibacteria bacterium]|nr:KH domain-containing protein [Candidatus Saccharibacteria bacterium]
MATIDQQFVEYIVKTLVNNPDTVAVERKIDEKGVLLSLTVDPEDVGRVIGKRGVTAQAIRVLLRALGTKQDARFNLKIVNSDEENGERRHERAEKVESEEKASEETDEPKEVEETVEEIVEEDDDEDDDDEESESSELAEKTRAELADLDDLDI